MSSSPWRRSAATSAGRAGARRVPVGPSRQAQHTRSAAITASSYFTTGVRGLTRRPPPAQRERRPQRLTGMITMPAGQRHQLVQNRAPLTPRTAAIARLHLLVITLRTANSSPIAAATRAGIFR
jgi:hypothetical protein